MIIYLLKDQILNIRHNLASEWSEKWMDKIEGKLKEKFPELSENELADYNTKCQNEMKAGHDYIFNISEALCKENVTISSADLFVRLKEYLNLKYNWINEDNLYRLMSQGCYYAYKEGYDGALN